MRRLGLLLLVLLVGCSEASPPTTGATDAEAIREALRIERTTTTLARSPACELLLDTWRDYGAAIDEAAEARPTVIDTDDQSQRFEAIVSLASMRAAVAGLHDVADAWADLCMGVSHDYDLQGARLRLYLSASSRLLESMCASAERDGLPPC